MKKIGMIPYFSLIMFPLLGFVGSVNVGISYILSGRLMGLLWASAKLGLISAVLCILIGLGAAIGIRSSRLCEKSIRWFFLTMAPVPYYIYALSWMYLVRSFVYTMPMVARNMSSGIGPCIFVNVMSFLPITTGLILMELESMDEKLSNMGLIYGNGTTVLKKILIPSLAPIMFISGILVFVLSITDYSVPSLFQYNTYTLEIFSSYSKGLSLTTVGLISLPLVIPVFLLTTLLIMLIRQTSIHNSKCNTKRMSIEGGMRILTIGALVICILQIVIPIVSFGITMGEFTTLLESIVTCSEEYISSLYIATSASIIAVIVSFGAILSLDNKDSFLVTALALLPLALPSSLIAMGLLSVVNGSVIHELSQTFLFPSIGCTIKYMPFDFLILKVYGKRVNQQQIQMARCMRTSRSSYFRNILLPMYGPALIGSFIITFLLSFGEESIAMILMPPGYQTLAVMIYNYLHYGASELVSGFCLLSIVVTILLMSLIFIAFHNHRGECRYD